jgi:hypothetical protein
LRFVLEDFFGEMAEVSWNMDRFMVKLAGKPSFPFKRMCDTQQLLNGMRWVEVWPDEKKGLCIITRQPDECTMCLAEGLTKCLGRCFHGKVNLE